MVKTAKRLPARERKKQILRCAVRVFARSNYRAATIADIAAEAGVSEALIYKHFPSKKSLLLQGLRHTSERIILLWQQEVDKEQDALQVMRNMGMTYYRRMAKHPEELKVQFQAIAEIDDKAVAHQLRLDHRNYMSFIAKVMRKGMLQGTVRKSVEVDVMAVLFNGVGILMNMMKLLSLRREFGEETVAKIMDHLIEAIKA